MKHERLKFLFLLLTFSDLLFDDNVTQSLEDLFGSRASKWWPQRKNVRLDPRPLRRTFWLTVVQNRLLLLLLLLKLLLLLLLLLLKLLLIFFATVRISTGRRIFAAATLTEKILHRVAFDPFVRHNFRPIFVAPPFSAFLLFRQDSKSSSAIKHSQKLILVFLGWRRWLSLRLEGKRKCCVRFFALMWDVCFSDMRGILSEF